MSDKTKIEWADATWSPLTGCTPISEGCANCYAKRMAGRNLWGYDFTPGTFHRERLSQPSRWKDPRRIFVCSMGDLFHPAVWRPYQVGVLDEIEANPRHTFLVLTKRPAIMKRLIYSHFDRRVRLPNLHLGVSAENQPRAEERILELLDIPAAVHFVSLEPLLGPINPFAWEPNPLHKLEWVIVGAETGPGRRHMDLDWARRVRDQCQALNVPFFFKKDSDGNHELDGRVWEQLPAAT